MTCRRPHTRNLRKLGLKTVGNLLFHHGLCRDRSGTRRSPMEIMRPSAHALQQLCGSDLEELAPESGVIQRRRKFDPVSLLRTLVFTVLKHPVPKPADYKRTALQCGVDISKAAITRRFNDALIAFLTAVLQRAVARLLTVPTATRAVLQGFPAVYLGDGTAVGLHDDHAARFPGCGGTAGAGR